MGFSMKKCDLSARLSRKNTIIALVCIAVFLIAGIVVAVVTHSSYVNKVLSQEEATITNYSTSPSSDFVLRAGTVSTLVYKYDDTAITVDLNDIIALSEGATFSVDLVLGGNKVPIDHIGTKFPVANGQKYFVVVTVHSAHNVRQNKYFLELVKKSDFSDDIPDFNIQADSDINYIGIDE